MEYGYTRISRPKQNIERQIRNILAAYPDAKIYQEAFTGTVIHRPEFAKLMKRVVAGDTIIFDSVSRMSRNADEGVQTYHELMQKGVELVFLKEPGINTRVYKDALKGQIQLQAATGDAKTDNLIGSITAALNDYLMELSKEQIRLAFDQAEKEVKDLQQRTREGIETARRNGKQPGVRKTQKIITKKSQLAKALILEHSNTFGGSLKDAEVQKLIGCSRNAYYKYKAELKQTAGEEECAQ